MSMAKQQVSRQVVEKRTHVSIRRSLKRRTSKRPGASWRLNWPLLLGTVVFAAAIVPSAAYWRSVQVGRRQVSLLDRATELEAEQKWLDAAQVVHHYLSLFPEDAGARVRRAQDFDNAAVTVLQKARAIELYALAQELSPTDLDLRRRQIELLLEIGATPAALDKAGQLLHDSPDDAVGLRAKALALEAQSRRSGAPPVERVAEAFVEAIERNPADADLALRLARIYHDDSSAKFKTLNADRAAAVMNLLVARQPNSPSAWAARSRYRKQYGLPGADDDLARTLQLDPGFNLQHASNERPVREHTSKSDVP